MTEAQLLALIAETAKWTDWWLYHTHDSRKSEPGFPDLVLVHRKTGVTLYRELKKEDGRVTPAQRECIGYLSLRNDVAVWRPSDWSSGLILRTLKAPATVTA